MAIGSFNTDYSPSGTDTWNTTDRLFVVGNGADNSHRSNALIIYKDGRMNINDAYTMPTSDGSANQIMQTDGSGQVSWVDAPVSAAGSIDTHSDVDVSTTVPTTGQVLSWNGSNWVPADDNNTTYTAGTGLDLTGTIFSLNSGINNLTDVDVSTTAPMNGQVLSWNGSNWVPADDNTGTNNTLDQAYDQGGAGAGKNITADNGAVRIDGTDGFLVTGTLNSGNSIDSEVTGAGTRMFFNPNKAAFRVGRVTGNQWDNTNIGIMSTAIGINTIASADYSFAIGNTATASGYRSLAMGFITTASGFNSTTMGYGTTAPSAREMVVGSYNTSYTPASTNSWDASDRLFVIGNGQDARNKSDALIVYKNGNARFNNKITAPASGNNADMKAYIYGRITASGNLVTNASSDGFSVTHNSTGVYTITFNTAMSGSDDYTVIATSYAGSNPEVITVSDYTTTSFKIHSWRVTTGDHQNTDFQFVVYKK